MSGFAGFCRYLYCFEGFGDSFWAKHAGDPVDFDVELVGSDEVKRTKKDPFPVTRKGISYAGAGYEARTRDIQLGKLTLYQLS